jgi:hypothetical protein
VIPQVATLQPFTILLSAAHRATNGRRSTMESTLAGSTFSPKPRVAAQPAEAHKLVRTIVLWIALGCFAIWDIKATFQLVALISADGSARPSGSAARCVMSGES